MRTPKKFVSIHNHTTFSPYDGLGYPEEHFKWCLENGLDAHAITEHGNFNSYAHAQLLVQDWKKSGKTFKYLPGIEAYFHPNLDDWRMEKLKSESDKLVEKERKKNKEKIKTELIITSDDNDDVVDIESKNALTIEDEDESKNTKHFNPLNRRHHLVLLPKNDQGLQELFYLTSKSFLEGYYRFPRMDVRMIKETITKGNVVASTACCAGLPGFNILQVLKQHKFDEITYELYKDKIIKEACVNAVGNAYDMLVDVFGPENLYLELQFNKLGVQHIINASIIEFAKRNGLTQQLNVTCDAHYYSPNVWRERELYKKLGFMNYKTYSPDSLPKSKDELKCELYPKNATQMWDEYLKIKETCGLSDEDDDLICDALERTHDIAHHVIGEVKPDMSIKLPKTLVPEEESGDSWLIKMCVKGLKKRGLHTKKEYVDRLKEELNVITSMKFSEYFVTLAKIIELGRGVALIGPGRGCFTPETKVLMGSGNYKSIVDIQVGDIVVDAYGENQGVTATHHYDVDEDILELEFENGKIIRCTKDHKFLTRNRGWVQAQYLSEDDDIVEV